MASSYVYCCPPVQARQGRLNPGVGRSEKSVSPVDPAVVIDRDIRSILRFMLGDGQDFSGHILLK